MSVWQEDCLSRNQERKREALIEDEATRLLRTDAVSDNVRSTNTVFSFYYESVSLLANKSGNAATGKLSTATDGYTPK